MKKCKLFFLVSLILVTSCAKDVIDLTGSIEGVVRSTGDNSLLEGCAVALEPGGASQITDANGYYCFADLEPNKYTLIFSKNGYKDAVKEITVLANKYLAVDVMLELKEVFSFSQEMIDFGDLQEVITFYVFNNSDKDCIFKVNNVPDWLKVAPVEGTINSESSKLITVTVDRSKVDYGKHFHTIVFDFTCGKSGQAQLPIRLEKVELTTPKVSCLSDAENITQNSFDIKGNILATGGSKIFRYGHCWSTNENPTVDDNCTFLSSIDNLGVATKYYVRAYAENSLGISYSEQVVVMTEDIHSEKWDGSVASSFAGGRGTRISPYIIRTGGQLLLIKQIKSRELYFELANNIDLNNINWLPISFDGNLNGNGYTIQNLKIERDDKSYLGLFEENSGIITNLNIQNIDITTNNNNANYVGVVAGYNSGSIENCTVVFDGNSRLQGTHFVGGLCGRSSGDIKNCSVISYDSSFSIKGYNVGGCVGIYELSNNRDVYVERCNVYCNIFGDRFVGGIAGYTDVYGRLCINQCEYKGKIDGVTFVGGIVGYNNDRLNITASKSDVVMFSENYAGGIVGLDDYITTITACYSTGTIECGKYTNDMGNESSLGGYLIYFSYSTITDVGTGATYHVSENNNISTKMKEEYSKFAEYWNFNNTWTWTGVVDGVSKSVVCPRLSWE